MEAKWFVIWDRLLFDWIAQCRPTSTQCNWLFNWVLDATEYGPDEEDLPAAEPGIKAHTIEDANTTVFYLEWPDKPVLAVVDILSI